MKKRTINLLNSLLVLLTVLILAAPAAAQYGPGRAGIDLSPEDRAERLLKRLDARLDLTDEQVEQARPIVLNHQQQAVAWLEAHPDATRADRTAHRVEQQQALQDALSGVLNEDQLGELDDLQSWRGARRGMRGRGMRGQGMRGRRGGPGPHGMRGPGAPGGGMLWNRLDLSDEQQAQLQELREEHRAAMREALEEILTEEQLERYDAMQAGPRWQKGAGRGFRGGPGFGMRGGRMMGRLVDALDLTEEQRSQVLDIAAQHREEGRAWQAEHPDATREERQAFMQAHHQMLLTKLEGVLTDEQLDEFDQLKARWQNRRPMMQPDSTGAGQK